MGGAREGTETFDIPAGFAQATIAREGDAGRRWLAELPRVVEALAVQWRLHFDGAPMHGYLGLVVPVRRGHAPCVLKLSWPDASAVDEATALAAWQGQGAVQLLAAEPAAGALLLERLDAQRSLAVLEVGAAFAVAGRLLRRLAIPAPARVRTLAAVAAELQYTLPARWEGCGRPLPRPLLEHVCTLAQELAPAAAPLLIHYDLHDANILAGTREPWLAIDPKVAAGDPEYGIAQLLWRRLEEIEAGAGLEAHFRRLVEAAALDETLARRWTLVRCVDYWLWALEAGFTEDPARCRTLVAWLWKG